MNNQNLLQQALECFEEIILHNDQHVATAKVGAELLCAAIAQPEQTATVQGEPVAWRYQPFSPFVKDGEYKQSKRWCLIDKPDQRDAHSAMCKAEVQPLYTPPQPATSAKPAQTEPEWIDDPHDIEQGMMRNPKWKQQAEVDAKDAERLDWLVAQGLIFAYPVKYRHGNFTELKFGSGIAVEKVFTSEVRQAIDAAIASQKATP